MRNCVQFISNVKKYILLISHERLFTTENIISCMIFFVRVTLSLFSYLYCHSRFDRSIFLIFPSVILVLDSNNSNIFYNKKDLWCFIIIHTSTSTSVHAVTWEQLYRYHSSFILMFSNTSLNVLCRTSYIKKMTECLVD